MTTENSTGLTQQIADLFTANKIKGTSVFFSKNEKNGIGLAIHRRTSAFNFIKLGVSLVPSTSAMSYEGYELAIEITGTANRATCTNMYYVIADEFQFVIDTIICLAK